MLECAAAAQWLIAIALMTMTSARTGVIARVVQSADIAAREKAKVLPDMVLAINMVAKCWKRNSIGSACMIVDVGT